MPWPYCLSQVKVGGLVCFVSGEIIEPYDILVVTSNVMALGTRSMSRPCGGSITK